MYARMGNTTSYYGKIDILKYTLMIILTLIHFFDLALLFVTTMEISSWKDHRFEI
jgi:hypothetical protein